MYYYFSDKDIEKYAMSDVEIENSISEGILSENIKELLYNPQNIIGTHKLVRLGIRMAFLDEEWREPSELKKAIYFTDFHLIILINNSIKVIPLSKVNDFKFTLRNCNGYVEGINITKKKSPVAGAVVGGLIAGPTGAIVGAIANQGEKKVPLSRGKSYDNDVYDLYLQIEESLIQIGDIIVIDNTKKQIYLDSSNTRVNNYGINNGLLSIKSYDEPEYADDFITNYINKLIFLITRTQNNNLTNEEKTEIVDKYINNSDNDDRNNENRIAAILVIFVIMIIIIIIKALRQLEYILEVKNWIKVDDKLRKIR